jgi:DNA-binding Lrp family transcriptional regulator
MIRDTSVEAFNTIKANGLLSEKRERVYRILYTFGPLIGSEVSQKYTDLFGKTSASETIRNRLTELRDLGVVKEIGKQLDSKTGMKVILWDVTSSLPKPKPKREKCQCCNGKGYIEAANG